MLLLLQRNPEAFCNCYQDLPKFYLFLAFYCCILDIGGERHYLGGQMSGCLSMVSYLSCYKRLFSLKLKAHFLHALLYLFNRDVEYISDVLWCRRIDISRLTFHADDILDVLL